MPSKKYSPLSASTVLLILFLLPGTNMRSAFFPGEHLSKNNILGDPPSIELREDKEAGRLTVLFDGREAFVYQYSDWWDLPHFWPLRGPSGKNMLVQKTEPYPHHRCFWFADTVRFEGGRPVSTYNALYTGQVIGSGDHGPPFRDRVDHFGFARVEAEGARAVVEEDLRWRMDGKKSILKEKRVVHIHALGGGDYLMDMFFSLTAAYGEVEFISDDVHYAWPYLRLNTEFSGENGGVITSSEGKTGQEATNMQPAEWMDYSNTRDGVTEGIAVFQWPDGEEHRWLTREYGCFGPRRPDRLSGKPFGLKKGESISQRVGILVHRGDVKTGKIAERYRDYTGGRWR
jgi:hypothetical protein